MPRVKPRRVTRRGWSRRVEEATLRTDEAKLRRGMRVFDQLPVAVQLELASEVARARARELCIAYGNVIAVTSGYKTTCDARKVSRLTRRPCVVFVVRRKCRSLRDRLQELPRALPAFASVEGRRTACAVPTDVVPETEFVTARAMAPPGIGVGEYAGNVACGAVLRAGGARTNVLISCMHVFTPEMASTRETPTPGAAVELLDSGRAIARGLEHGGRLRLAQDGQMSFDVQLARAAGRDALRAALDGMTLADDMPYVPDKTAFDAMSAERFELLTSPNNPNGGGVSPLRLRYERDIPREMGVTYDLVVDGSPEEVIVYHRLLLRFRILGGRRSAPGDSGSPIVLRRADGTCTLVAMHIAGPDTATTDAYSYGIPAWALFIPAQYAVLPRGATLSPLR